jgi:hypothetical protein
MTHYRPDEPWNARLVKLAEKVACARRFARALRGDDPAAARLEQYADELTAEAERIETEYYQACATPSLSARSYPFPQK